MRLLRQCDDQLVEFLLAGIESRQQILDGAGELLGFVGAVCKPKPLEDEAALRVFARRELLAEGGHAIEGAVRKGRAHDFPAGVDGLSVFRFAKSSDGVEVLETEADLVEQAMAALARFVRGVRGELRARGQTRVEWDWLNHQRRR